LATQRQIDFWQGEIETCQKYMGKRHKLWRRLLDQYRMDYNIPGLPDARVINITPPATMRLTRRMSPMTRCAKTSRIVIALIRSISA